MQYVCKKSRFCLISLILFFTEINKVASSDTNAFYGLFQSQPVTCVIHHAFCGTP